MAGMPVSRKPEQKKALKQAGIRNPRHRHMLKGLGCERRYAKGTKIYK